MLVKFVKGSLVYTGYLSWTFFYFYTNDLHLFILYYIYLSITNKMQRYTMIFITINALHVSGGSSAHHQELKTVYTASEICRAFTAS